jgi:hypothetical protein
MEAANAVVAFFPIPFGYTAPCITSSRDNYSKHILEKVEMPQIRTPRQQVRKWNRFINLEN